MITRREVLKLGAVAGGGAAASQVVPRLLRGETRTRLANGSAPDAAVRADTSEAVDTMPPTRQSSADKQTGERILVVIELAGGNDGMNTVVPYKDPAYRRLRTETALDEKDLVPFTDDFALNPSLQRLAKRGVAVIGGVGVSNPDGSHFEMQRRWARADFDGKSSPTTGFLGRMADIVGNKDAPAVALGLGSGSSAALVSKWAPSVSIRSINSAEMFLPNRDDGMLTAFQQGFRRMASTAAPKGSTDLRADVGSGMVLALRTAGLVATGGDENEDELPGSDLGRSLASALRLLRKPDLGLRIVHITHDGFDTHSNTKDQQGQRLAEFDEAVDGFLAAADRRGLGDRIVVATTSEFGRRAKDNGSNGLDHGAASVALLTGAVHPGMHSEYSSLTKLDGDDNLIATVMMDRYLATLGSWLGIDHAEIFSARSKPIDDVFRS